ncbi:hypothetical protein D5F11_020725 [Siminovitchia terrae]|uniref:Uncharacterized protein n=1 Tax=Siminovitchia terrae TaxID=1914933 RepID=A0A429X343_SIMTE|nr:hypothetical protein D5F11_020725 [Siminovitchia terrae]
MRVFRTRFRRILRLHNIEFFQIVLSDDDRGAFLLVYDEERVAQKPDDGNHIRLFLISNFELSDSSCQDVLSFNDDLLGMKPNCSYFMDILRVEEEFDYDFPFHMLAVRDYIQEILSTVGIDEKLPNLKNTDFNYLSQDRSCHIQ